MTAPDPVEMLVAALKRIQSTTGYNGATDDDDPVAVARSALAAYHAAPKPVITEAMVLAGCRAVYPGLFAHGLNGRFSNVTVPQSMEEIKKNVEKILVAALTEPKP